MSDVAAARSRAAIALRRSVVGALLALIALVVWWCVAVRVTPATIVLAFLASAPLWLALPRLIAGHRRTYQWISLALAFYLALAITESVANPARRLWAGTCLFVTLMLFVLIVAYLRATRGERAARATDTQQ